MPCGFCAIGNSRCRRFLWLVAFPIRVISRVCSRDFLGRLPVPGDAYTRDNVCDEPARFIAMTMLALLVHARFVLATSLRSAQNLNKASLVTFLFNERQK